MILLLLRGRYLHRPVPIRVSQAGPTSALATILHPHRAYHTRTNHSAATVLLYATAGPDPSGNRRRSRRVCGRDTVADSGRVSPPLSFRPEAEGRSGEIRPRISDTQYAQPDVSTTLRFARHDRVRPLSVFSRSVKPCHLIPAAPAAGRRS